MLISDRSQIFVVKYEYLRSLQLCEELGIPGKLEKRVRNQMLAILTTYMETRLNKVNNTPAPESLIVYFLGAGGLGIH